MKKESWEPLEGRSTLIEKNWLFTLERLGFRSTKTGREHDFYVVDLADAVTVVALTPKNEVVLVRQFRAGSRRDGLEPPGGLVDPGEDVCEAAERELREETGYAGDPPLVLGTCWANPSILSQRITTVLIQNAERVGQPTPDAEEEVEIELVSARSIPRLIQDGQIHHALGVMGLMLWLASQIPGAPWETLAPPPKKRWQFNLKSLVILVALSAVGFAALRHSGPAWLILAITFAAAVGPAYMLSRIDPFPRAVLLRNAPLSREALTMKFLAGVGAWAVGGVLALVVMAFFQFVRAL